MVSHVNCGLNSDEAISNNGYVLPMYRNSQDYIFALSLEQRNMKLQMMVIYHSIAMNITPNIIS